MTQNDNQPNALGFIIVFHLQVNVMKVGLSITSLAQCATFQNCLKIHISAEFKTFPHTISVDEPKVLPSFCFPRSPPCPLAPSGSHWSRWLTTGVNNRACSKAWEVFWHHSLHEFKPQLAWDASTSIILPQWGPESKILHSQRARTQITAPKAKSFSLQTFRKEAMLLFSCGEVLKSALERMILFWAKSTYIQQTGDGLYKHGVIDRLVIGSSHWTYNTT